MATRLRNVRIDDNLWTRAGRIARARNESLSDVIRVSLTNYANRHGGKVHNGFPNAETAAFMRIWENDETLYRAVLAYARDQYTATPQTIARNVRDGIIAQVAYGDTSPHPIRTYLSAVAPHIWDDMNGEVVAVSTADEFVEAAQHVSESTIAETITDALAGDDA